MATQKDAGPPSAVRPTGTVTFLFSDIEGSTSRWEQNREEMAAALARHDALMRMVIERHRGYVLKPSATRSALRLRRHRKRSVQHLMRDARFSPKTSPK